VERKSTYSTYSLGEISQFRKKSLEILSCAIFERTLLGKIPYREEERTVVGRERRFCEARISRRSCLEEGRGKSPRGKALSEKTSPPSKKRGRKGAGGKKGRDRP